MAKNRSIPFGYTMMCGRIVIEPAEANAVIKIFTEYINGRSLSEIARLMSLGNVSYSEYSDRWNKNMVKRIIENQKYIGAMDYPQIIDEDIFIKANSLKEVRCTLSSNIPDEISAIRERTYCAECGHRLTRKGGNSRYERWDCSNIDCRQIDYRLTDNMLMGAVVLALNTVIANPEMISVEDKSSIYFPTADVRRKENEISRMIDTAQVDNDRIKEELFSLAEMKFECCEYNDIPQKTEQLMAVLAYHEQLNSFDIDLFKACVSRIWVSHFYVMEIELINGMKIKNITERTDENENSRECNDNTSEGTADGIGRKTKPDQGSGLLPCVHRTGRTAEQLRGADSVLHRSYQQKERVDACRHICGQRN